MCLRYSYTAIMHEDSQVKAKAQQKGGGGAAEAWRSPARAGRQTDRGRGQGAPTCFPEATHTAAPHRPPAFRERIGGRGRAVRTAAMAFLFSKPLSPAEQLRKHKREIDRAVRDLERERNKLQMQEKKIIAEIRKAAQQNQQVRPQNVAPRIPVACAFCATYFVSPWLPGSSEDYGQGSRAHAATHNEILPDENTFAGCLAEAADSQV